MSTTNIVLIVVLVRIDIYNASQFARDFLVLALKVQHLGKPFSLRKTQIIGHPRIGKFGNKAKYKYSL